MLSNNSLLLSSKALPIDRAEHHQYQYIDQHDTYYPPSPPLSTSIASSHSPMSKVPTLSKTWHPTKPNKDDNNTSFLNLEKVIQNYASQPELLELILASKVEEDKRRAEEAKLRRKEIDYMLQKKNTEDTPQPRLKVFSQNLPSPRFEHNDKVLPPTTLPPISSRCYNNRENSFSSASSIDSMLPKMTQSFSNVYQAHETSRSSLSKERKLQQNNTSNTYLKTHPSQKRRNSSSIEMLLSPLPNPMDRKLPDPSINTTTTTLPDSLPKYSLDHKKRSSFSGFDENNDSAGSDISLYPDSSSSKRRKREMQAVTTIVETKEFPYNDDYLWKNNGNTVHKKTGFKSIYYKCSNSSKGCPVNKTVTFKDNGEHLIKYRGQHLVECNRIKRIIDLNK